MLRTYDQNRCRRQGSGFAMLAVSWLVLLAVAGSAHAQVLAAARPIALVGTGRGERDKTIFIHDLFEPNQWAYQNCGPWLDPQRFSDFDLVVLTNGTARPGDESSPWSPQDIQAIADYLHRGGRLLVMQWAMGNLVPRGGRDVSGLPFFGADQIAYNNTGQWQGQIQAQHWPLPMAESTDLQQRTGPSWLAYTTSASGLHDSARVLVGQDDRAMAYVNPVGKGEVIYLGTSLWQVEGDDREQYLQLIRALIESPGLRTAGDMRWQIHMPKPSQFEQPYPSESERQALVGVRWIDQPLPWWTPGNWVRFGSEPPDAEPLSLDLTRYGHRAEDGHLDAIVQIGPKLYDQIEEMSEAAGCLQVRLFDQAGQVVREHTLELAGQRIYFSLFWPHTMIGQAGRLSVAVQTGDQTMAEASEAFVIHQPMERRESGRIRLDIPNTTKAHLSAAPMTVGVPFPVGVLYDTANLRLVDERGQSIPLQVKPTARWSRFGSIKWVLCDFVADLAGRPRTLHLEYGPGIARVDGPSIAIEASRQGALSLHAGRVRVDDQGVAFDVSGQGDYQVVLTAESLAGAFVEHVKGYRHAGWGHHWLASAGTPYSMPRDLTFELEQSGPVKVVLKASGWFTHPGTGERFCQFVNRYVIHRDSPVMRVFHTWIFTGDGNRDVIRNMGWRFSLPEAMKPVGFLPDLSDQADWQAGYYLRQHDHDAYDLFAYQAPRGNPPVADAVPARPLELIGQGKHCSGVMAAQGDGVRVYAGVQDFWQNFPSSLMLEDDAMTFYQWPRYGREASHSMTSEQMGDIWRLWFAHEGETLNFRLPRAITEGQIFRQAAGVETFGVRYGDPESANAQGIAKTAEMWLYMTGGQELPGEAARVLRGLHDESLRAVVDPVWMADSGAFYEVTAMDKQAFPQAEQAWLANVHSVVNQIKRMGIYGKWIYGDLLRGPNLDDRTADLYRTFRRSHWGWPLHWVTFARTGDTELLRTLQANVRVMTDVGFRHYVDDQHEGQGIGTLTFRLIPWANYRKMRSYVDEIENFWHAWYVTGYDRGRDVIDAWADAHKRLTYNGGSSGRGGVQMQKQYMEQYQATWDPWFFMAAHVTAKRNLYHFKQQPEGMHIWETGPREYQRWTQHPEHQAYYQYGAAHAAGWQHQGWAVPTPLIPSAAYGYHLSKDRYLLRRLAGLVDLANWTIWQPDQPWYYQGVSAVGDGNSDMLFTSWYQKSLPLALHAFRQAGEVPDDLIPLAFHQQLGKNSVIAVLKQSGEPLALQLTGEVRITDPAGDSTTQQADGQVVIPGDAPGGVYRIRPAGAVLWPISPPDTPEIIELGDADRVETAWQYVQYWFKVPAGMTSFTIRFYHTPPTTQYYTQDLRQVVIWDGDRQEVWSHRQPTTQYDSGQKIIEASITVPEGQDGRLWRITMPGRRTMPFELDAALPPVLAHDPVRWFDPSVHEAK